jgi:hypothetical protein
MLLKINCNKIFHHLTQKKKKKAKAMISLIHVAIPSYPQLMLSQLVPRRKSKSEAVEASTTDVQP